MTDKLTEEGQLMCLAYQATADEVVRAPFQEHPCPSRAVFMQAMGLAHCARGTPRNGCHSPVPDRECWHANELQCDRGHEDPVGSTDAAPRDQSDESADERGSQGGADDRRLLFYVWQRQPEDWCRSKPECVNESILAVESRGHGAGLSGKRCGTGEHPGEPGRKWNDGQEPDRDLKRPPAPRAAP